LALRSDTIFSGLYERLFFKTKYTNAEIFSNLVENRSGVINVVPEFADSGHPVETVYGGGAYDGRFNTDIVHDTNGLFRAYVLSGLHPTPKRVLVIGLASGSWTQVVANDPNVEDVTIVEINPGYLPLIAQHAEVASQLRNPKVHIVIDDGRRWLVSHPDQKFDFILMNTTLNWRANSTNLLSREFLQLLRAHLRSGGIAYYNTTWSVDAMVTGAATFPYSLRISNFMAVSDSPLKIDKKRWRTVLCDYRIDGHPVFDLASSVQRARMEQILSLADEADSPQGDLESGSSLRRRFPRARLITDDNMGTEWR
jgi:SAM-dependent methyltransferase